jgi:hypothetical protein
LTRLLASSVTYRNVETTQLVDGALDPAPPADRAPNSVATTDLRLLAARQPRAHALFFGGFLI